MRWEHRWVRYSFATWLLPFVETELLCFGVVASITMEGYHALLVLNDKVAAAWRSDKTPMAGNWAGRLAKIAGCTRTTVYNRQEEFWQKYGIDISFPLQMYSDILYYGHSSTAKPDSITALMVAVDQEEGDEAVRLHAEAIADFERKRVKIVNPALVSPPRAMELKLPPIAPPDGDFDALPFLTPEEVDWVGGVSARPTIAPSSAKASPPQVRQGPSRPWSPASRQLFRQLWQQAISEVRPFPRPSAKPSSHRMDIR